MLSGLARLFVSLAWVCAITPPTVKSSIIVTSSVKATLSSDAPILVTAVWPVVPEIVTSSSVLLLPVSLIAVPVGAVAKS